MGAIAYLGPEGTFTHVAALRRFGSEARLLPCPTIAAVFEEVERGRCERGVVPVENSSEGAVGHTLDSFMDSALSIVGEELLAIEHGLLGLPMGLDRVERVGSHPQALAQCRRWLGEHLPHAALLPMASTADAARQARDLPGMAAIASPSCAELYGLALLARDIHDERDNTTRFLVLGPSEAAPPPSGRDRTSLLVLLRDEPGALLRALAPLAELGVNLSKIESRPSRRQAWHYAFFLDLDGHAAVDPLPRALERMQRACELVRTLGSYPRA